MRAAGQVTHRGIERASDWQDAEAVHAARWRRWQAALLRKVYDCAWLPESVAANVVWIDLRPAEGVVVIVLRTGTRLVDRHDRIDVVGRADDIAISELVEAVQRRGWAAVRVHGDEVFRAAVAARLRALEPPIAVTNVPEPGAPGPDDGREEPAPSVPGPFRR